MPFISATATCHLGRTTPIESMVRIWVALLQFVAPGLNQISRCRWLNLQPCRWGDSDRADRRARNADVNSVCEKESAFPRRNPAPPNCP
jgi:hypothetical protein